MAGKRGGSFGARGRRERQLQKLQDEANCFAQEALAHMRAGRGEQALAPNQKAIDAISRLRAEEPENEQHLEQLAGKLYNHAGMLAQAGRINDAVASARRCLASYLELSGGEIRPDVLATHHLLSIAPSFGGFPPPDLTGLAARTADAKCRLASLLARSGGAGTAEDARQLGLEATTMYRIVAEHDARYRSDLERMGTEYRRILELTEQS